MLGTIDIDLLISLKRFMALLTTLHMAGAAELEMKTTQAEIPKLVRPVLANEDLPRLW
jgi:hypothetical protein